MSKTPLKITENGILYMNISPLQLAFLFEKPSLGGRNHLEEFRVPSYAPKVNKKGQQSNS